MGQGTCIYRDGCGRTCGKPLSARATTQFCREHFYYAPERKKPGQHQRPVRHLAQREATS